jgi:cytoplasmic iron level regulating protein YaaA (DUF328/UPF0246 family)
MPELRRTLVLACSATKIDTAAPMAAFHRYDGPAYRVLRKHYCGLTPKPGLIGEYTGLHVYILSAKYGLIPSYAAIEHYDQRMTPARARLMSAWSPHAAKFRQLLHADRELFVVAGADYRTVLDAWAGGMTYRRAAGGIGEQLGQLKRWLVDAQEAAGAGQPCVTGAA